MKEQLFQALKQAYQRLGLSEEILREYASVLDAAGTITDHTLPAMVRDQESFLSCLQRHTDRRVRVGIEKARKEFQQTKGAETNTEPGRDNAEPDHPSTKNQSVTTVSEASQEWKIEIHIHQH
jgi:hypothetical protein